MTGRVVVAGESCAQTLNFDLSGEQVGFEVAELGVADGRIEFDENVAGPHALAVSHMDGAHHGGFERLDDLGAHVGYDLARSRWR